MTDARQAAARVLLEVEEGRATLATAIDRARAPDGDRRDQALLIELAAGTLRWRNELDALITTASRRGVDTLDARVRAVLRVGTYQLRHLDRIPPHAIVHEAVELIRVLGQPRAAGFVNAVLRALARGEGRRALPRRPPSDGEHASQMAFLVTTLSHPAWLMERWLARYGFDATARWCEFNNAPPAVTIRATGGISASELAARIRAEGIAIEPAPYVADAWRLPPGSISRLPADVRALLRVQDEGSQLVARVAGARPGERVLDVCAAPGGKTLIFAGDMGLRSPPAPSLLVAGDRRPARLALLTATLAGAGVSVPVVALDAAGPLPFAAVFDRVILDVPCSGLGTLRRDPDLKWIRTPEDLSRLAAAESRMLAMTADVVRPGGRLVYATCSSEPDENLDVVRRFLAHDRRFRLEPLPAVPAALRSPEGCLTTTPPAHGLDSFFAALLVRREDA